VSGYCRNLWLITCQLCGKTWEYSSCAMDFGHSDRVMCPHCQTEQEAEAGNTATIIELSIEERAARNRANRPEIEKKSEHAEDTGLRGVLVLLLIVAALWFLWMFFR